MARRPKATPGAATLLWTMEGVRYRYPYPYYGYAYAPCFNDTLTEIELTDTLTNIEALLREAAEEKLFPSAT
jgi:hypothetical protein